MEDQSKEERGGQKTIALVQIRNSGLEQDGDGEGEFKLYVGVKGAQ